MSTPFEPDDQPHPALGRQLREALEREERAFDVPDAQGALSRLHARQQTSVEARDQVSGRKTLPIFWRSKQWVPGGFTSRRPLAIGAMGITALTVLALVLRMPAGMMAARRPITAPITYTTKTAQRAILTLADGSKITLAPRTTLVVGTDFGRSTRTVTLHGEAYFDITPQAAAPFIVHTGHVRTQVLGTQFDIRAYTTDPDIRVAVVTGRVVTGGLDAPTANMPVRSPSAVIAAGMVGHVTDSTIAVAASSDAAAYSDWTNGHLVFRDVPVPEVLATLGRWYGFEFRLNDSTLSRQHLSATFTYGASAEMLAALKPLLGVTITFDGTIATLHPQRATRGPAPQRSRRDTLIYSTREIGR